MAKVIGIDLGTTNSCVAVMEGSETVVIPNLEGNRTTPSVVGFTTTGERLIGQVAKRQAVTNPDRTIQSIKREMGSDYKVAINDKNYTPQEISAMILSKLKSDAEAYLGTPVTQAVITVPAYFTDSQRQATKDAGRIAGLDVLNIINEPTAASLAYGINKKDKQKILVYDFGGGTFDVSILDIADGVFEVLATAGNNKLGGDNFDKRIVDYLLSSFKLSDRIDLRSNRMAMQRIREAAEKAKIELSSVTSSNINLPYITTDATGSKHMDITLTRAKFDELTADLVQKTMDPVKRAMSDASVSPSDIDKILLVGGSTRIPAVQEAVKRFFGKEPFRGVNPDECVAVGAAIQGASLTGYIKGILSLDVTPFSLGIETKGGVFTKLIERNTTIPTKKSQVFSTAADGQTQVEVKVLQGDSSIAANNIKLGTFILSGIMPAPRGVPKIEVTFDIDRNGIVNVSAKDKATGKEQNIIIQSSSSMSEERIQKAIKEEKMQSASERKSKMNSSDSQYHSRLVNDNENGYVYYLLSKNRWEPNGFFSLKDSIIFDRNGNALYRYDSGWLVSYKDRSLCHLDAEGRVININNQTIGLIGNYKNLPKDFDEVNYKDYNQIFIEAIKPVFKDSSDYYISNYWSSTSSDMTRAENLVKRAINENPNSPEYIVLYATHLFLIEDNYAGQFGRMRDTDDHTLKLLYDVFNFCNQHLSIAKYSSVMTKIRDLVYYLIGEYYATHDYMMEAERILNSVNVDMFPYKSVLMAMVISYNMDKEYERTGNISQHWEKPLREEINLLKRALLSPCWFNPYQKSIALTDIQGYTSGIYFNISELEYSYQCLLFARDLKGADMPFINSELKKYRKTYSGKLEYDFDA